MTCPVVLLAGGLGTRLREETDLRPKPMVEIGGRPILWHIMKVYAASGFREFVVCLGYKGEVIKNFFYDLHHQAGSVTVETRTGKIERHGDRPVEDWTVHLLETGADTMTGGRVRRAAEFLGRRRFMLTYGDGVGNIDLHGLLAFHHGRGRRATITAVRPPARFGGLTLDGEDVLNFAEKPQIGEGWINGGYMVLEPEIVEYLDGDETILEREPLERLAEERQLSAFRHHAFWQPMDTVRDVTFLRELWETRQAPWKVWEGEP